jgi:mRNA-degrading endonuclease toxin of MazEF toxin-antitoxin module
MPGRGSVRRIGHAAAIVSQIRLIDTLRLINKVGTLDRATFNPIRKAVRKLL